MLKKPLKMSIVVVIVGIFGITANINAAELYGTLKKGQG